MDFNIDLAAFPSTVHKVIYSAARGLTPPERSLTSVTDADMRSSCKAFHSFMTDMLSDMYDHPEAYGLPVLALENLCGGKKVNGVKRKFPSKTKNILSQTRNAVNGYVTLLCLLGRLGTLEGNVLSVSPDTLKTIQKRVSTAISPIPLDKRLEALSRVGLSFSDNSFISTRYPDMFAAMCALARKDEKLSGFHFFAFCNAEFRNLNGNYKPTYEDYFHPLPAAQCKYAYILHEFAVQSKLNPVISTFWKVDYKYKGVQVMCIGTEWEHERMLDIRIVGTYHWDDPGLINDRLAKETPEFQKQVLRHIWRCDACATTHLGRFVTVLGKRQRVCGGGIIGFRWRNPSDDDLDIIKRLIQIRCEIIDEIKSK